MSFQNQQEERDVLLARSSPSGFGAWAAASSTSAGAAPPFSAKSSSAGGGQYHTPTDDVVALEDVPALSQQLRRQLDELEAACMALEESLRHPREEFPAGGALPSFNISNSNNNNGSSSSSSARVDSDVNRVRSEGRAVLQDTERVLHRLTRAVTRSRDSSKIGAAQNIAMEFEDLKRSFLSLYARTQPKPAVGVKRGHAHATAAAAQRLWASEADEERSRQMEEEEDNTTMGGMRRRKAPPAVQSLIETTHAGNEVDLAIAEERAAEFRRVQRQLIELSVLYQDVAAVVHSSAPMLDNIESNLNDADDLVASAVGEDLRKASVYQSRSRALAFPLGGLVVGALIAGPVGAVAGLKGGAIIGAASLGAVGGLGTGIGVHKLAKTGTR